MPRCFTIRKHSAQHNLMQHEEPLLVPLPSTPPPPSLSPQQQQHHQPPQHSSRKIVSNSNGKNSENCDGKKTHRKVAVIQRASNRPTSARKSQTKNKGAHSEYDSRSNHIESSVNGKMVSRPGNRSNNAIANGDWKVTLMQRKRLESSTNATVQQQCKTKVSGPTSPTEATIAPIYYNGNTNNTRNEGVIISSKINDFEQISYETKENYHVYSYTEPNEVIRCETSTSSSNHMSIVLKNGSSSSSSSSISNAPVHETSASISSSSLAYKSNVQSVIQSTSSTNSGNGCTSTAINVPIESSTIIQHNSHPRSHTSIHDSNANYQKNSATPSTLSNQYFVFRSGTDNPTVNTTTTAAANNPLDGRTPPSYRERSIEETEAAHDLLSLSQSLPPLPAPCVVTILHPVTNFNGNSPDVQEITATNRSNNEYITYTSGRTIQYTTNNTTNTGTDDDRSGDICTRNKKHVSTQFDGDMLPEDSFSSDLNPQITPLTPPTSESSSSSSSSSSSDVEFVSEAATATANDRSTMQKAVKSGSSSNSRGSPNAKSNPKAKSAQVFGMTIFDAVMINDGRSKKSNGDAEIIHIEERRKGRYKCSQCGKQYATSSNLSRHKQTHRSLDSQSAKRCNTCGKAYVSMPALAMHLLTHKLTHSCDVCGKLFSRPWLLQGHLRSHTGEKPYGCAHCGKAFADRSNLRAHMQTHSVNKQFECTKCHKTFALKSYLNKHLESSCFRDEGRKPGDGKLKRNEFTDSTTDVSMDDDTIDVTVCSPRANHSADEFCDDDDDDDDIDDESDEDINIDT